MRLRTRAHTLALTLGALCAAPAAAQPALATATPPRTPAAIAAAAAVAEWTGVYRVEARNRGEMVPMRVVVERLGDGMGATLLVDNSATALDKVRNEGGEFRAVITTSAGRGDLVLRATAGGVTGTLTVGKTTWTVTGERTG
jgi:hypothetical protein